MGVNIICALSALIANWQVGWDTFRTRTFASLQGWSFAACKRTP